MEIQTTYVVGAHVNFYRFYSSFVNRWHFDQIPHLRFLFMSKPHPKYSAIQLFRLGELRNPRSLIRTKIIAERGRHHRFTDNPQIRRCPMELVVRHFDGHIVS